MVTKTRPDIKWLLVERATLVGDIAQLERCRTSLDAEIARLRALVAALDTSVCLAERRVQPDAAGTVRRHRQSYGRRGALQAFIVQTLGDGAEVAWPREVRRNLGISSVTLRLAFLVHFTISLTSKYCIKTQ